MTRADWLRREIMELRLGVLWIEARYDDHFPPAVYAQFDALRQRLYRFQAEYARLTSKVPAAA